MGRADLVRQRESGQVQPAVLPPSATYILERCRKILENPAVVEKDEGSILKASELIVSLESAPSQRVQTAIIKLLGVTVSKFHPKKRSRKTQGGQKRVEESKHGVEDGEILHDCKKTCCDLCFPLLATLLTRSDDFSSGIQGATLRALLRCNYDKVEGIKLTFQTIFDKLRAATVDGDCSVEDISLVRLAHILMSEAETRHWMASEDVRGGTMKLAAKASSAYLAFVSRADNGGNSIVASPFKNLSKVSLNSVCDFTMKAAQELCQVKGADFSSEFLDAASSVGHNGYSLLKTDALPRAYVMGVCMAVVVIRSIVTREDDVREFVTHLRHELHLTPYVRLGLIRAVLEAPTVRKITQYLIFDGEDSIYKQLETLSCGNLDGHLRFTAFDAIIDCIRRSPTLPCSNRGQIVSLMYQRWEEAFPGIPSQMRRVTEALFTKDKLVRPGSDYWVGLTVSLIASSWTRRGKYAPLSVLIQRVHTDKMLKTHSELQENALSAISLETDLSKPVADFLENFWAKRKKDRGMNVASREAARALGSAIESSSNNQLRQRIGDHLLPAYFRQFGGEDDGSALNTLLNATKSVGLDKESQASLAVTALSAARRLGQFSGSLKDPMLIKEIRASIRSLHPAARLAAFELVATCRVTTEPMLEEELSLVLESLAIFFSPGALPGDVSRFRQLIRRFAERLFESMHAAKAGGGWWSRERRQKCDGNRSQEFENKRLRYIKVSNKYLTDICCVVFASTYPGAPMTRRTTALAVLNLLGTSFGLNRCVLERLGSPLVTLSSLLECLTDEWESSRNAAWITTAELRKVAPVTCLPRHVESVLRFAETLLYSAKQREADTGALLVRWVFHMAVATNTSFELSTLSYKQKTAKVSNYLPRFHAASFSEPALRFTQSTLDVLFEATLAGEKDLPHACLYGLVHGPALVLRLILMDLKWSSLAPESVSEFLTNLIRVVARAIKVAMKGICFQEPNINALMSSPENTCEADEIFMHDERQKLVTSCFLSIKELCSLLGILVHRCPILLPANVTSSKSGALHYEHVVKIGDLLDDILRHTRHNGVIDKAAQAVQLISTRLLALQDPKFNQLPLKRVKHIVESATTNTLYVLRRSAGAPAYIVAIVRAEVGTKKCSQSNILSLVMTRIFTHLRDKQGGLCGKKGDEAAISHCFNILRVLFLDGDIAKEVPPYFAETMELAVLAFGHTSWFVRNSALMVFSALVRRALGVQQKSSTRTRARAKCISAPAFFRRYPGLHEFLLLRLKAVRLDDSGGNVDSQFGLYPILHLLAKLGPGAVGEGGVPGAEQVYMGILSKKCCSASEIKMLTFAMNVLRHLKLLPRPQVEHL